MNRRDQQMMLTQSIYGLYSAKLEVALSGAQSRHGSDIYSKKVISEIERFFALPKREAEGHLWNTSIELMYLTEDIPRDDDWSKHFEPALCSALAQYPAVALRLPKKPEEMVAYVLLARKMWDELSDLEDEEVAAHYLDLEFEQRKIQRLLKKTSGDKRDLYEFFSRLSAQAEFDYWLQAEGWTAEECVALSLGKDPRRVNLKTLAPSKRSASPSPFREEFQRRVSLLGRAVQMNKFGDMISPLDFSKWASSFGWSLPNELKSINERSSSEVDWKDRYEQAMAELARVKESRQASFEEPGKPTRKTLYKMILGMAIARFEHRTGKGLSASSLIEEELRYVQGSATFRGRGSNNVIISGITVSDDKIREALEAAADHLSVEWKEKISWSGIKRPKLSDR